MSSYAASSASNESTICIFGWDGKPQTEVNIANQVGVVCDEATRMRLIELRNKLQAERLTPMTLPEPETQPQASVATGDSKPATPNDAIPEWIPGATFSAPAGAKAPIDASPTYRAWLEYERPEPDASDETKSLLR